MGCRFIKCLIVLLFLPSLCWGASYYVCSDGNGAGDTAGSNWANCMDGFDDIGTPTAGDTLYLRDDDGTYREMLTPPSSGSSGSPITYAADTGESPKISGADLVATWSDEGSNVWSASFTPDGTAPLDVWFDTTEGTRVVNQGSVNSSNEWFWASNILYIYSTSNPDTAFTSPGIEAGSRGACIWIEDKDYITIDGIDVEYAAGETNGRGILIDNSDYVIIQNLTTQYNIREGIFIYNNANNVTIDSVVAQYIGDDYSSNEGNGITAQGGGTDDVTITACTANNNRGDGLLGHGATGDGPDNLTIQYSTSHTNGEDGIDMNVTTSGIVEYNLVYGNGTIQSNMSGIALSSDAALYSSGNIVRYNFVRDNILNSAHAIRVYYQDSFQIYGNVIDTFTSRGVNVDYYKGGVIYNNTIYGGDAGFLLNEYAAGSGNVIIKNNIADAVTYGFRVDEGTESYITSDYNYIDALTAWGRNPEDEGSMTLAQWQTNYSEDANSSAGDPLLTDDFTLSAESSCIDAGENLGATYDDALNPTTTWPSNVLTGDQDDYGSDWEIGAYYYFGYSIQGITID